MRCLLIRQIVLCAMMRKGGGKKAAMPVRAWSLMVLMAVVAFSASCSYEKTLPNVSEPAATASAAPAQSSAQSGGLRIFFIDVGKGDAALIGTPDGRWIMVDTGPKSEYADIVRLFKTNGIRRLEAVFITHPHGDHMGGLREIMPYAECPIIYTTPVDYGEGTRELADAAEDWGAGVKHLHGGAAVTLCGIVFTALGPNGIFPEENDNSLVFMMEWEGGRVLFAGDQLFDAEQALLDTGWSVRCDILKAGHHGEADASSPEFMLAAGPRYCVVTNDFKEADEKAYLIRRMESAGAEIYVLCDTGTLLFELSAGSIRVSEPPAPEETASFYISALDKLEERVSIRNGSEEPAELTGWSLFSEKGDEWYFFPDGLVLGPSDSLAVYSGTQNPPADGLLWTYKKIWHDSKEDPAVLYDPYGREIDRE